MSRVTDPVFVTHSTRDPFSAPALRVIIVYVRVRDSSALQ